MGCLGVADSCDCLVCFRCDDRRPVDVGAAAEGHACWEGQRDGEEWNGDIGTVGKEGGSEVWEGRLVQKLLNFDSLI